MELTKRIMCSSWFMIFVALFVSIVLYIFTVTLEHKKQILSADRILLNKFFGRNSFDGKLSIKGVVNAEGEVEFNELFDNFCTRSICGLGYPSKTYS